MDTKPTYFFKPQGTCFRVYKKITEYEAESVGVYSTIDEAKKIVYELNGWNYKSNNQNIMQKDQVSTEIQLVQIPVITHKLKEIGLSVTKRIEELNLDKQIATEDSIQFLKKTRAELNGEANQWEAQRKAVKSEIMSPYDEFETVYKAEIIDKYKAADAMLKDSIGTFELNLRTEKRNNIITYFNELCAVEGLDWLKFDRLNIDVTLSVSEKKYKEQVLEFITKTKSDLDLINSEEHSAAMMVEYKQTLNASLAITTVRTRKQKEKEEDERFKMEQTSKREDSLRKLGMVYHDISKTFNWVRDESILVSRNDIENLSKDEWTTRFVSVENSIKVKMAEFTAKTEEPKIVAQATATSEQAAVPVKTTEVLKAPVVETQEQPVVVEEVFEATFVVTDTFPRLKMLQEFLVDNNFNYKNID